MQAPELEKISWNTPNFSSSQFLIFGTMTAHPMAYTKRPASFA
jgi:hypothetical protein